MPIDLAAYRKRLLEDDEFFESMGRTMKLASRLPLGRGVDLINLTMEAEGLRRVKDEDQI